MKVRCSTRIAFLFLAAFLIHPLQALASTPTYDQCIYALDPTAAGALNLNGAIILNAPSCGVVVNSSSSTALKFSGSGIFTAKYFDVAGGYYTSGAVTLSPKPVTGSASQADPLTFLVPPVGSTCTYTNFKVTTGSSTLSPGTYCNGITISGATNITFNPGTYILMGGGLNVSNASILKGSGVTFFLTKGLGYNYGPLSVTGSVVATLSAPTSGPYYGILFYQDRSIGTGQAANTVTGSSASSLSGVLYFPTTALTLSGAESAGNCLIVVADTISLTGAAALGNGCSGVSPLQPPAPVTVSVAPSTGTLYAGQTQQFTASVANTSNTAVTWTIAPATGAGTVSTAGLYTAPATISTQQTVTVTATSQASTTVSASATVTLMPKSTQTISFANPGTQTVGTPLTLVATASSGLAVSFTSATTSICTVSGTTATFVSTGTCTIDANQAGNSTYAAATMVSQSFSVNGEAQTITFPTILAQTVGTPLALSATASSGLAVSFTSATTSICTVSGATATFLAAGTCTIDANQTGNSTYAAATMVPQSFTVNGKSQTISFPTIPAQTVGTPLTLSATASSGLLVSFTSATTTICTVSGTTATFVSTGTCTIDANQAGNSTYAAATMVPQSFTVNGEAQTITFGAIAAQTVGTPLTLSATASSGLAVIFTSTTQSICTVTGATATYVATGTCTIDANQAGNSTYAAAPMVAQSFSVNGEAQTITFPTIPAQTEGTPLTLSATASSGLAVIFTSTTQSICTVSGTAATFLATGTCIIDANQAGSTTYAAATMVAQSFTVNGKPQTITFGPIATQTVGTPLTLSATASSGLAVSFTSTTTNICTVSGATTTFLATGTCTIDANQAGNSTYAAATMVPQSFTVNGEAQTITFPTIPAQTVDTPLTLSATANSGLAISFTSTTTGICTVSGTTATFVAAGTCTIDANQTGNSTYAAATMVPQSFSVNGKSQTITFANPGTQTVGTPLTLSATASSGLAVSFTSTTQSICAVSGTTATFVATGTCTIDAIQAGNSTYAAATMVPQSFTVNGEAQTITFANPGTQTVGTPLTLSATASSGLTVSFTPTTTTICTVSGATATFAASGTCTIDANQTGNSTYAAGTMVPQSFSVNGEAETITFGAIAAQTVATPLTLSATASSGLVVSFTSTTTSICTVSGTTATFVAVGTCTIDANQAGNSTYAAATMVPQSFTVNGEAQTITFPMIPAQSVGAPLTLSATASSGLAVSFTSTTTSICTVSGATATFIASGTCTIDANQAGNSTYAAAPMVAQSFSVNGEAQTISFANPGTQTVGKPLTLSATANSGLAVSFTSTTTSVCTVSGTAATFVATGACTIDANQAGNSTYATAPMVAQGFQVNGEAQTITFPAIAAQTVGTPLTLAATASSGLAVSFTSTTTGICTVSGTTATFIAAGTCTIDANQAGNSTYAAATMVPQSFTVSQATQCTSNGYSYQRAITIDHTQVPNTDQTNFPFLFSVTDPTMETTADGGHVTNASGYDIVFSSDPFGQNLLNYEMEEYNPATGQVVAWVQIPDLSHSTDTVIYLFYGNANVTASQANPAAVWDSNYKAVWHLSSNGTAVSLADSTANANNATSYGGISPTSGQIDGAMQTTYGNATAGTPVSLTNLAQGNATFSAWVYTPYAGGDIMGKDDYDVNSGWALGIGYGENLEFLAVYTDSDLVATSTTTVPTGIWSYVTATLQGNASAQGTVTLFINGTPSGTTTGGIGRTEDDSADPAYLGYANFGYEFGQNFYGSLDELRISSTIRSADWIATEYNNQNTPGTFSTMSTENVAIAPTAVTLSGGQNQQFVNLLANACAPAATWTLSPIGMGTLTANGLYTAPAAITTTQTVTVTATSPATSDAVSATVTLLAPISIQIAPTAVTIGDGSQTLQFTATVQNTSNTAVTWTLNPAGAGTIDANGLYTAPAAISAQQTVTVTATSVADPTQQASAVVTLVPPSVAPPVCGSSGYSYQRAIVVDHTQVPNTDQVNFPLLFNTTDPMLATTANGGHVTNAQGYDIYFSLDPNGATKLDHELEEYNPATGQVVAWVRIPLLSHATDMVVYMFYGNPNVNTPQQNPTGVWDNNYLGVWHVANGTTLSLADSTSNGNNATNNGAQPTQGEIDGGMLTNGTSYATIGAPASLKNLAQGNATFSAWVNTTAGNGGWVLGKDGMDGANGWSMGLDYNNFVWFMIGGYNFTVSSLDPAPNTWSYVTVALDQSAAQNGQATIYINGVPNGVATGTAGETGDDSTETAYLANAACGIECNTLIGSSDELRISNTARSADWIAAEYNNQSSPGTFYALNGENAVDVLPAAVTLYSAQAQQFVVPGPGACVSPNSYAWSIAPATIGSISDAGLYTAPANVASQQTVTVTAANTSGGAAIKSGTVTLMPAVSIGVSPAAVAINGPSQTQQFTATVLNTPNTAVTWTISPAGVGTIDATGLYTVPATLPTAPQTVTITATSQADSTKSATATVTLALVVTVNLDPTSAVLYPDQIVSLSVTGENTNIWNVNWTITPASDDSYFIAWTGVYEAPTWITAEQTVVVTATSQLDPTQSASTTITLEPPMSIAISPTIATINTPGQTEQFAATVTNNPNTSVTWTISPSSAGQISETGLYTAPSSIPAPSTVEVTATSVANPAYLASAIVSLQPPQCASNRYAYQRAIVIDHTQVQNTDQQNFPFLFSTMDPSLASVNNGGHVASDNGYDIIFSLDPAGQQRLDHELEEYSPQTGQVIAWVRIPTLSHGADTVLYVFYGNPNITTPQQNPAGVWDANYMGVWHMANGPVLSLADSTVNGDNATNNGAQPTAGEIDGGMLTGGTTYATIGTPSNLDNLANGNATFSAWINTASGDGKIMGKCNGGWVLGLDNTYVDFATANLGLLSSGPISNGKWTYITATLEGSSTQGYQSTIYMNGFPSASGTSPTGGTSDDSSDIAYLANGCGGPGVVGPLNETSLNGSSDEYRISNIARSADWIATEYNNQNAPGTFYALQPENAMAVVPGTEVLYGGQAQQFTVSGQETCAEAQLTWSIIPQNAGSISSSGVYTVPATIAAAQTVTVTATSQTSSATISPATITLMPPVGVTLAPASLTINTLGQTQQYTATVTNATNTAVVWSMSPLSTGTLSSSGLYTGPNVIGQVETVTITATSVADPTESASATITLTPPLYPGVNISPSPVTIITPGETVQFTATTTNISQTAVTWTLTTDESDGLPGIWVGGLGSISSTGLYTAPPAITTPQTVDVFAWFPYGSGMAGAGATVYLVPKPAIALSPASSTLFAGQSQQFKATVTNETNTGVAWTVNPAGVGSISGAGLYIAPPNVTAEETVMITATSTADVNLSATVPLVLEPSLPSSAQCWSGYSYQRSIVIDHGSIQHSDQINFPFLFDTTDRAFRMKAYGGHVTSAAGYDIAFSTDPEGRTMLDYEIEAYNPATGHIVAWVRIPDLSHTADTVLYVFYGNATITAPQQNAAGVWDRNFEAVYHLATPGSGVATDSTAYQNNGVLYDAAPASGEIDGAAAFDGATTYLQAASAAFGAYPKSYDRTSSSDYSLTFGLWFNTAAPGTLLEQQTVDSSPPGTQYPQNWYTPALYIDTTGNLVASVFSTTAINPIVTSGVYDDGNWHYAVDTYSNGTETLYVDGQTVGSMPHGEYGYGTGYNYFVGVGCCGYGATWTAPANSPWLYFGGMLDEVRVSAIARSADWIAAEYSDQSAPGSFYALSAENAIAVLPAAVSLTASEAQQFAVAGTCANGAAWSISPSGMGTISPEGLYTAPNSIPAAQTVQVTATGYGATGPIASATVTLVPPVSVSVTPPSSTLTAGQTQQFTATVANTANSGVVWTMNEADGSINSTGVYTAPDSISSEESVTVTATSQADPTQSASATITLLPASGSSTPPGLCAADGYNYQSAVTIDHTKVPNTDQVNFPFLFNTTNLSLASTANGGGVASPNGYDIIFSLDANGQTKLDHEIEEYNPATGQLIAWVRIPTLSHTTDTIIYMFYGNPNIVGSQQNPAGTWNSNYQGVYHLASEAANNAQDSSSYRNVGTLTSVGAGMGEIDGTGTFNGSSSYMQIPGADFPNYPVGIYDDLGLPNSNTTTPFQASFGVWFQTATSGGILTQTPNSTFASFFGFIEYSIIEPGYYDPPGWDAWMYVDDNGLLEAAGVTSTQTYTDNKWHYAVTTYATDGTDTLYVDGQKVGSTTGNIPVGYSAGYNYFVGTAYTFLFSQGNWDWLYFNGNLDEVTVANVPFSADWVQTQYNNQASPATFYSFNPATSAAVSPATVSLFASQSQQFATTGICNAPVTWTQASGAPGTLTAGGFYTAPSSITQAQNVQITATNQTTNSTIGAAVVTLLPPPPPITLVAAAPSPYATGSSQEFVATLMSQDGTPLSDVTVAFTVSGANAQLDSATTDTSGQATFSYAGGNTGTDNIQASAGVSGEMLNSGTVSVLWVGPPPINPEGAVSIEMPPAIGQVGLMSAFTDGGGNVIEPVAIGATAQEFLVPAGASQLQLGLDDNHYSNNGGSGFTVAVNGATVPVPVNAMPWGFAAGVQNNKYQFGSGDGGNPVVAATGLTAGQIVTVAYQSGTVSANYPIRPLENSNGDPINITGTQLAQGAYYPTLYTTPSAYPVGQPLSFSLLVVNGSGVPLANVPVTVTISGANPGQYQSVTDSTGTAVFLYTGSNAGTDTIQAEATPSGEPELSSTPATVNWTAYPAPSSAGSLQLQLFAYVNNKQDYIVQATDANGNPVANANIGFYVWGADNIQSSTTTDKTGHASFSYYHVNDGAYNVEAVDSIGRNVQVSTVISGVWPPPSTSSGTGSTISVTISGQTPVTLPNTLQLNGTVTDNAGVTPALQWSQVSGPAPITFSAPTQAVTTASFSQVGTYVVQLYATDSISNATAQLTVTVDPVPGIPQGWIGSPAYGSSVTGIVPITLAQGVTIANGTLYYYPTSNPSAITVLNANVNGGGQIGQLDTTMLANGSYDIEMSATDTSGSMEYSMILVSVIGNYKPGRLTTTVTDLVVPANGLPINIQRSYDSLNANTSSDFGYGWSLSLNVDLTVDPAGNVTFTLGGQRKTFYFTPKLMFPNRLIYIPLYFPDWTPEPGLRGTLGWYLGGSAGIEVSPEGSIWKMLGGADFSPDEYFYTDPNGTVYSITASGQLLSIWDKNGNFLYVSNSGITSSAGVSVPFVRDAQGRITTITDPQGNVTFYSYDTSGNLATVQYPNSSTPSTYTYDANHLYLSGTDARGNPLPATQYYQSTFDSSGQCQGDCDPNGTPLNNRLKSVTDALGETKSYAYVVSTTSTINGVSVPNTGLTTITYPTDPADGNGQPGSATMIYDSLANLLQSTDPLGNVTTNTYDANRNLLSMTDPLGHTTSYTYDANGNKTSTTYPATATSTNTTSYTSYNQYSEPTSTTDELGNIRTTNYDANYNPQSVTDSLGTLFSFQFNANGTMAAGARGFDITQSPARASQFTYDAYGDRISKTDALGRTTTYAYDALGRKTSMTKPVLAGSTATAATTTYQYDALGHLTQTSAPLGRVTSSQYDANGNKISDTDARGYTRQYKYDALNRLAETDYPDGTTAAKTYDFRNNVVTETDRGGHVTIHQYDLAGREISVTQAYGTANATATSYAYDNAGRMTRETDALGHATNYTSDAAGSLTAASGVAGNFTFAYDNARNAIAMTDGNGNTTQFQYDARNRLTVTTYPDGTTKTKVYDSPSNLKSVIDQASNQVQYNYDAANQLTSVVQIASPNTNANTTSYGYDANGNPIALEDANTDTTTQYFDVLNELTQKTLPDGSHTETRTYDSNGNLTSVTHFNGLTTTYTYDALNRLLSRATPGEGSVSFAYTQTGKYLNSTYSSGSTTYTDSYTYDSMDRIQSKVTPEGTLNYTYDAAGNVASISSSNLNGAFMSYTYDDLNRLATVTDNRLAGNNVTAYTYDNASNVATVTLPNGVQSSFTYDTLNRVKGLSSQPASYTYQRGQTGNLLSATESSGRQVNWSYDGIYRLTNETISLAPSQNNGAVSYGLDPVGNRLSESSSLPGVASGSWTFNSDDQISNETYDANGNVIAAGGKTFSYDSQNKLVSMNGGAASIVYDAFGERVAKSVNGVVTRYLVEDDVNPTGIPQVFDELNGAGQVARAYAYGLQRIDEEQVLNGAWSPSFYVYDGGGSVRQLTDYNGNPTDTYEYDAYGNSFTRSGTTPNNYLYRGEQFDPDLGLYYLRDRYYNPASGRFYSRDPKDGRRTNPQSLHKYLYTNGDPVNGIDPMGQVDTVSTALVQASGSTMMELESSMMPAQAEALETGAEAAVKEVEIVEDVSAEVEDMTTEETKLAKKVEEDCLKKFGMHEPEDEFLTNAVTNEHHMVARFHDLAAQTRYLLKDVDFGIDSAINLVTLPFTFHQQMGLHNPTYFKVVEDLIDKALMEDGVEMENVKSALDGLAIELQSCAENY